MKHPVAASPGNEDVRMRGFAARCTVTAALAWIDRQLKMLPPQRVPLADAAGRALAEAVVSDINVPGFTRAMMDGYALSATATQGASPYNRLAFDVIGQSLPGQPYAGRVSAGQAVRIMTGAPLADGCDAVLPVEQTEGDGPRMIALGEVPPGRHVGLPGEDIRAGTTILAAGRILRPQDLGLLASIGRAQIAVVRQPRVRIVVTGNELLPAGTAPADYEIADANGPMLAALVTRDGGRPLGPDLIADDPAAILAAMQVPADVILASGGSSVGQEDHVPRLVAEHGELAIHGVAMRPSSPAGMGRLRDQLVFLLPGNPVSCLCAYDFFAGRAIRGLGGRGTDWPYLGVRCQLERKLVSVIGRTDYARVTLADNRATPLAITGASILSSTTRADGFVIIPADSEGYPAGTEVDVYRYDA
jgi:molybdopterin molybdotransferase